MTKQLVYQVLSLNNYDEVFAFAERNLEKAFPDEAERMFASWAVRWRKEALEHYLRLGWSFIVRDQGQIVGFFLAQPFLFFRGQTQTLWVEHIEALDPEVREGLVDVAARVAREKHLQRVLFADADQYENELKKWSPSPLNEPIAEVKTTKG